MTASLKTAITLTNVSKRYRLYRRKHQSLKEMLLRRSRGEWRDLWALRDASFAVAKGDTVGIVGENGSGKSTTLKLLAGILEPDGGVIRTEGRVASVLELGAGFEPEYTGRENIHLYASLLGLRRAEIDNRFDQIVAFSELESFIEYPVKNYSSGMYMRLGFAVAIHIEPDILLIDEILAVGDAHFQEKCLDQLARLRAEGRTIVVVSHDLESVKRLCDRVLWLDQGRIVADGTAAETIAAYLEATARRQDERLDPIDVPGFGRETHAVRMTSVRLLGAGGAETRSLTYSDPLTIEIAYRAEVEPEFATLAVNIFRSDGLHCTEANTSADGYDLRLQRGVGVVTVTFPVVGFNAGTYDLSIALYDRVRREMYDLHERQHPFTVRGGTALATLQHYWDVAPGRAAQPSESPEEHPR
jgi:ABC-type polysaccharide/polyol phosphate transport system ATPase subunit